MSYAAGAAGAGAAAAAIAQAIKASGAIVRVEPADFMTILSRSHEPLVVLAETKFIRTALPVLDQLQRPHLLHKISDAAGTHQ